MSLTVITTTDEWVSFRWIRRYRLDDGRIITMELYDYEDGDPRGGLTVSDSENIEIARCQVTRKERKREYIINMMFVDMFDGSYKRKGIGRACLQFFNEHFGPPKVTSENIGQLGDDDDAQHARAFIAQMIKEGLMVDSAKKRAARRGGRRATEAPSKISRRVSR